MKKKFSALILILMVTLLCGCYSNIQEVYPNCYVYDVDDANNMSLSICPVVCNVNDDAICYYDDGMIYKLEGEDAEILFSVEKKILGMANTNDGLYFILDDSECENLYKYDWETQETIKLYSGIEVARLVSHCNRVFFRTHSLIYSVKDEEIICINDLIKDDTDGLCNWEDYYINIINDSGQNQVAVINCNDDDWRYFYKESSYISVDAEKIKIDNTIIKYNGTTIDYSELIESENDGAATSWGHVVELNNKLYILYQCGKGVSRHSTNSPSYLRAKDAIYSVDINTREMTLVYETEDNSEQIAGFSVERDELYLVKQDGVYRCDMQGNNEVKIVDGYYDTLVFEDCNDYFFIYDASDLHEYKLLLID